MCNTAMIIHSLHDCSIIKLKTSTTQTFSINPLQFFYQHLKKAYLSFKTVWGLINVNYIL